MPTLDAQGLAGEWLYTGNPASCERDWVRFAIGDVIATDQLVSNEEIAAAITDTGSKQAAAIRVGEHLLMRWAREVDLTTNDGAGNSRTKALSQRMANMRAALSQIRSTGALTASAMPYAGGISIADKDSRAANTDRVPPAFSVGMSDYR